MILKNRIPALILLSGCLAAGNAIAAGVTGDMVYQKEDMFVGSVQFTDSFMIEAKGIYQATFKDFESASTFESSGMGITDSISELGNLTGPGSFTFSAEPGKYDVSMFAMVGALQVSVEEKQRLMDEEQRRRGKEWWGSLTEDQQLAKKELWENRTEEEWQEHHEMIRKRLEWRVEEQLAAMNTGTYGIDISAMESPAVSAVPLPAAAWLFGSGMLALAGIGRRKSMR